MIWSVSVKLLYKVFKLYSGHIGWKSTFVCDAGQYTDCPNEQKNCVDYEMPLSPESTWRQGFLDNINLI